MSHPSALFTPTHTQHHNAVFTFFLLFTPGPPSFQRRRRVGWGHQSRRLGILESRWSRICVRYFLFIKERRGGELFFLGWIFLLSMSVMAPMRVALGGEWWPSASHFVRMGGFSFHTPRVRAFRRVRLLVADRRLVGTAFRWMYGVAGWWDCRGGFAWRRVAGGVGEEGGEPVRGIKRGRTGWRNGERAWLTTKATGGGRIFIIVKGHPKTTTSFPLGTQRRCQSYIISWSLNLHVEKTSDRRQGCPG